VLCIYITLLSVNSRTDKYNITFRTNKDKRFSKFEQIRNVFTTKNYDYKIKNSNETHLKLNIMFNWFFLILSTTYIIRTMTIVIVIEYAPIEAKNNYSCKHIGRISINSLFVVVYTYLFQYPLICIFFNKHTPCTR